MKDHARVGTGRIALFGLLMLAAAGRAQTMAIQWQSFAGPAPAGIRVQGVMSEPLELGNVMVQTLSEKIYKMPWTPGEAILLEADPEANTLVGFGFWAGPEAFKLLVRRDDVWLQVTPETEEPVVRPRIAYFGHEVSGQGVDWGEPARILLFGDTAAEAVRIERIELWRAGCVDMTMQRCERELAQARQWLGWAKQPHPRETDAVEQATEAVLKTRQQIRRDTKGLLDAYMSLSQPRYVLEVMANHCRHFHGGNDRLSRFGFPDAWKTLFYGRPEFPLCWNARAAAQEALWSERPWTLPAEAQEIFGPEAGFAISITHGLTKFRRDKPFPEPLNGEYRMSLARDEYESFQVVLASWHKPVRNATVAAEWTGPDPHPEISFRPVGYVHTKPDPTNLIEYVGWWPDPLMPPGPVNVAPGETQPVWGSVHAPPGVSAGDYTARLTVTADGMSPLQCDLKVHVFDFDLGLTHLPSLLSLRLDSIKKFYKLDEVTQDIKRRWYAFCLRYRMNPNNIYTEDMIPEPEDLQFCVDRGFNAMVMHTPALFKTTRNSRETAEIWVSNDNRTYQRVDGDWAVRHGAEAQIVVDGLSVNARYVKFHSTVTDTKSQAILSDLHEGKIIAYDGADEMTGPVGFAQDDDGTKPLGSWGADWGSGVDHRGYSLGVDLGEPRHVTGLALMCRGGASRMLSKVKAFYEAAAAHGLADRAYVYGFDEWSDPERYGIIKETYEMYKDAAPGIKACSTVVHPVEPIADVIDAWCPCLSYNYAGYEDARRRGQEIWYYAGGTPYDPFPTHELLNVPAVEARAFFWLAWRFQYTGWLHWELNCWYKNMGGEERWPEIPWDPARNGVRNGELGRIYPGPDATPLPSVRLENMRDGIEDYDYFWILNGICEKLPDGDPRKASARKLMDEAIMTLCPSRAQFERDPEKVLAIHERLGRTIEELQ